jgi:hypothetical protein
LTGEKIAALRPAANLAIPNGLRTHAALMRLNWQDREGQGYDKQDQANQLQTSADRWQAPSEVL